MDIFFLFAEVKTDFECTKSELFSLLKYYLFFFQGYEYSRSGNPTRNCLENCIAALEGGKHGMVFASGLATTNTITFLLKAGDHLVSMNDLYGGTNRLFRQCTTRMGIEESLIDCTDLSKVETAIKPNTKVHNV